MTVNRVFTQEGDVKQVFGSDGVNVSILITSKEDGAILEEVLCGGFIGTLYNITHAKGMESKVKEDGFNANGWAQIVCLDSSIKPHILLASLLEHFKNVKTMLNDLKDFAMDVLTDLISEDSAGGSFNGDTH